MSELDGEPHAALRKSVEDFGASLDAASGPLKRMAAIVAQIGLANIPADASCHCLCSIYESHQCGGWRADGCQREIPSAKFLGMQPAPTVVPLCRPCAGIELRQG